MDTLKYYSVFVESTGEFLRSFRVDADAVVLNLRDGELAIVGEFGPNQYYARDGAAYAYAEDERVRKAAIHPRLAEWSNAAMGWIDKRSIDDVRADKWSEIKQARDTAISAPLNTPFGIFDADDAAQANISKRVLLLNNTPAASLPTTIEFTRHDNSVATLTPAQMVQVGLLIGAQVEAAFANGRALRFAIAAAKDTAAVTALKW